MKKRWIASALAAALSLSLAVTPALAAGGLSSFQRVNQYTGTEFADVDPNIWYADSVKTAYELDLVKGSGPNSFAPDGSITLAATLTLACRLHSIYHTGTAQFQQGDPWYQVYVDYALANGIIADGQFSDYNASATRRQFASILSRALPREVLGAINTVDDGMIPDVPMDAPNAADIYLLYRAGVLTGNDLQGTFAPETTIARSAVAAIVSRMADPGLRKSITLAAPVAPTPAAGTLQNPLPADNTATVNFQKFSFDSIHYMTIQCIGALRGAQANALAHSENMFNDQPAAGQEWRFYEFKIQYIGSNQSMNDIMTASDLLFKDYYFNSSGSSVNVADIASLSDRFKGLGIYDVEMFPGSTARVVVGLLINADAGDLLLRIPCNEGKDVTWLSLTPDGTGNLLSGAGSGTETPDTVVDPNAAQGSLSNPLPADSAQVIPQQRFSFKPVRNVKIQCTKLTSGSSANQLARSENMFNDQPAADQEWRFYEFDLEYLSSSEGSNDMLEASDLLFRDLLFKADGSSANIAATATLSNTYKGYGIFDVNMYPGSTAHVVLGVLVSKNVGDLLLRVPTDGGDGVTWIKLVP